MSKWQPGRTACAVIFLIALCGQPASPFTTPLAPHLRNRKLQLRGASLTTEQLSCPQSRHALQICMSAHQVEKLVSKEGSITLPWPVTEEHCEPVHVRIVPKGKGLNKMPLEKKCTNSYVVFVNDTQKQPTGTGVTPLSIVGDGRRKSENHFTMLGDFRIDCPSYLHYLPPVANEDIQRLWVTSFGMARNGGVVGVDLTGRLEPRICNAGFVWPNAVEYVEKGALTGVAPGSILVSDGFLVPGKNDGHVWLVEDPGGAKERAVVVTPKKKTFFYHRAVPLSINGHQGILTARACKPMNPFLPAVGELVWLEKPNTLDPLAAWNLPWREVVVAEGPDVMFEVIDMDPSDDTVEVFAAEFFAQRLTLHSLVWDDRTNAPRVVQRDVLDDTLGQAYCVTVADLEGPRSHLLVTTHEDLAVQQSSSSALSFLSGRAKWSYTKMPTPKDCRELGDDEKVVGGSLFAYEVPRRWRQGARPEEGPEAFRERLAELFRRLDSGAGVSEPDLQAAMASQGVDMTAEEVKAMFDDADWDGSGMLEYAEFEQLMMRARFSAKPLDGLVRAVLGALELPQNALEISQNAVRELENKLPNAAVTEELFVAQLPQLFDKLDVDSNGSIDMVEMQYAMSSMGVSCTDVELAAMFIDADTNGDGKIDWAEFETLMINMYKNTSEGTNVLSKALSSLERALSLTAGIMDSAKPAVWRRRTLASGFQVKRIGINPGAPGFVYPFHPHAALEASNTPPHLLLAGDCADAAYVFRPARGANGELNYELMATFGCEGTVGSVALGWGDTVQSVEDGWVKFFVPVYEEDRVYMIKCGEPPMQGYTPDDEW